MGQKMPVIPVNFTNVGEDARWYTIVTKFNYEQKFVKDLWAGLKNVGLEDQIVEVVVPNKEHREKVIDKNNKEKEKITIEKVMPLYVFVKAVMDERVFYYLRNTAGCANIMAAGGSLLIMTEDEINKIKQQCGLLEKEKQQEKVKKTQALKELQASFSGKAGDSVKIADGMFADYIGTLQTVNFSRGKASVILENGMPVEVDLTSLQLQN